MSNPQLTTSFTSPSSAPFTINKPLSTPQTSSTEDKAKYLESLREAISETQHQINKELTRRMDEDKAREAAAGGKPSVDEEKEEENYGEEVQEEED